MGQIEQEESQIVHEVVDRPAMEVDSRKLGIWVFLGSEAMFFSALIATYVVNTVKTTQGPFPKEVLSLPLVSINTFVLIASSLSMVIALSHAQERDTRGAIRWLIGVVVLGLLFLGGQAYEFTHLYRDNLTLSRNLFGASFFVLTGTHGLHVLSGIIWIIMVIFQLRQRRGTADQMALKVELAGLYWHFVDLIWIIIFTVVYLLEI